VIRAAALALCVCALAPAAGADGPDGPDGDDAAKRQAAVLAALPTTHQAALAKRADAAKVLAGAVPTFEVKLHEVPEKPRKAPMGAVQFSPDGRTFLAIGGEGAGKRFDTAEWQEKPPLIDATVGVATVAWEARNKYYATSGSDGALRIWRAKSGKKYRFFEGSEDAVYAVAFGPKGKLVAAAGLDGRARVWTVSKGKEVCSVSGYGFGLRAIAFLPDAKSFLTAGVSEKLEQWSAADGTAERKVTIGPETTADGEDFVCWSVSVHPAGELVSAGGSDGKVRLYALTGESGVKRWARDVHPGGVYAVAFSPDGKWIATAGRDGKAALLEAEGGAVKRSWTVDGHAGFALGWSAKAPYLATVGNGGTARVWVVPEAVAK
jgi:WD40 repeat protein